MNSKFDYDLLSAMMTNANMGWWEADLKTESYICSEYISRLLGLDEDGTISFKDFNKRILKEEQRHTTTHSFDNIRQTQETVYLLNTVEDPTWIRSKICLQRTDENGNVKVYGIAETQDGPDMSSASQALQERNRLLHNIYKYLPVLRQTTHPQAFLHVQYTLLRGEHIGLPSYELVDENPCILGIHQYPFA